MARILRFPLGSRKSRWADSFIAAIHREHKPDGEVLASDSACVLKKRKESIDGFQRSMVGDYFVAALMTSLVGGHLSIWRVGSRSTALAINANSADVLKIGDEKIFLGH